MEYTHAAPVTVAGVTVWVQCFRDVRGRDPLAPEIAAPAALVPVEQWPLPPDAVAAAADELFVSAGCARTEADVAWAVQAATLPLDGDHYWLRARTPEQIAADIAAARRAAARGEID